MLDQVENQIIGNGDETINGIVEDFLYVVGSCFQKAAGFIYIKKHSIFSQRPQSVHKVLKVELCTLHAFLGCPVISCKVKEKKARLDSFLFSSVRFGNFLHLFRRDEIL